MPKTYKYWENRENDTIRNLKEENEKLREQLNNPDKSVRKAGKAPDIPDLDFEDKLKGLVDE